MILTVVIESLALMPFLAGRTWLAIGVVIAWYVVQVAVKTGELS